MKNKCSPAILVIIFLFFFAVSGEALAYRPDVEDSLIDFFSDPANTNAEDWSERPYIDLWNRIGGESAQFPEGNFTDGDKWTVQMPNAIYGVYEDLSRTIFGRVMPVNTGFAYDYSYYIGSNRVHEGLDIQAGSGSNVRSATEGTVVNMVPGTEGAWETGDVFVYIKETGTDRIWVYGHLQGGSVIIGDSVREGANLGQTNNSNHLHLAVYSESAHSYAPYYDWPDSGASERRYQGHVDEMLKNRCSPLYAYWLYKNSLPARCADPERGPAAKKDYLVSVAIVIDVSGSMSDQWADGVKMESAKAAALELIDILEKESSIEGRRYQAALISFSDSASIEQTLTSDFDILRQSVENLRPGGSTNIGDGLEKAFLQLEHLNHDLSYIVFLSDGMSNRGLSPDQIRDWLRRIYSPEWVDLQASFYGFNYGDGVDTRNRAGFGESKMITAGYNYTRLFNRFTVDGKSVRELALERIESDIVFNFNGHANNSVLSFKDERLRSSNLMNLDLNTMKLAVLAGCKTAEPLGSDSSITQLFRNLGSDAAIGFSNYVNNHALEPWLKAFWENALDEANPISLQQAFTETNNNYRFRRYSASAFNFYRLEPQFFTVSLDPIFLVNPETEEDESFELAVLPKVFTIGYGDPGDLDEELLRAIARLTGGEYFYGNESFDLSNIFIKIPQVGTGSTVGEFSGTIAQDENLEAGSFNVESSDDELRVALNWPGSHIDLILRDPAGKIVGDNYRGLKYHSSARPAYVVIEEPMEGLWSVELYGKNIPEGSSPYYVIASVSDIIERRSSGLLEFFMAVSLAAFLVLFFAPRLIWSPDHRGRP